VIFDEYIIMICATYLVGMR